MKNKRIIFNLLIILFMSCNNNQAKKENNDIKKNNSTEIQIDQNIQPVVGTVATNIIVVSQDSVLHKDTVFLQCLELSDTTRLLHFLQKHDIISTKIEFGLYASRDRSVELYPKNKLLSIGKKKQRLQCGYFFVTIGEEKKTIITIGQINGDLAEFRDSSHEIHYIEPPIIGDSCMYFSDDQKVYQMVKDFFKLAKSGKREKANEYILYPVVVQDGDAVEELFPTEFWKQYDSKWSILESKKVHSDFIAFGNELYNLFSYDRTSIRFSEPQRMGGDYYYMGDDPTQYTCGYYIWWIDHKVEQGTRYETTYTFYMRVININGEPRICSFFMKTDKD